MDLNRFTRRSEYEWEVAPHDAMRVPAIIYASESLVREMDDKVYEQAVNVAALPGIQKASFAMPDAHWGYGFPIGGVAAFDAEEGGVVSAGGVGFDISCGVRTLLTGMPRSEIEPRKKELADVLHKKIPARGIFIRSPSSRGVAEEAPGAYKNVSAVVDAADHAHLARKVAKLEPIVCVKG